MTAQAAQQDTKSEDNPLDRLSTLLRDDMVRVNEKILTHMQADVALIPQLAGYLIASGGKRIRPLLTLAATMLSGGDMNRAYGLAASVEFIHTATLLHDDVVDGSLARRGKDTANLVFGNQASVLVGDFLFSRAFQLMVKDGSLEILRILSDASAIISQGEVKQLATTNNLQTTMNDYIEVISAKTAALFAAACEIGPVIAGQDLSAQIALRDYGLNLGIAFQIADDVLDYNADQKKLGKTIGDDFREGKMTAPILLALENATPPERSFWQRTIGQKQQNDDDLMQAMEILERHNALHKGLEMARTYGKKSVTALHNIKGGTQNEPLAAALSGLVEFSINRGY
ncbi:MAG: farnesyltranstransferase [Alphaproteobacteria bacterium CG_4_9_14_3_um_filter_47_13]|nr:MAG: farnesyltranstransferase [Alphaproteobacteria bacterium CG_4_9_14_3_um_filter_47_13]